MPPQYLYDISGIDLDRVLFDQEQIRQCNPHRGDMEMLNSIVFADPGKGQIIGYKDVRHDEFWVPGHIPGRPLFPGVLMIETVGRVRGIWGGDRCEIQGAGHAGGEDVCDRAEDLGKTRADLL